MYVWYKNTLKSNAKFIIETTSHARAKHKSILFFSLAVKFSLTHLALNAAGSLDHGLEFFRKLTAIEFGFVRIDARHQRHEDAFQFLCRDVGGRVQQILLDRVQLLPVDLD